MKHDTDYLILDEAGWGYEINLNDLSTPEKLLWWINHLKDKTWYTASLQNQMINICNEIFGYECNYLMNMDGKKYGRC